MTEPEPPAQAGQGQPRSEAPANPEQPGATAAPAQPGAAPGQPPHPPAFQPTGTFAPPVQPPPGALPPPGYPDPAFLAPPRPRVRWINPQRRTHVAGVAVAIALVCGGAGIAIGWAASDHHDGGTARVRMYPPGYYGQDLPGQGRLHPRQLPGRPVVPTPSGTATS